VNFELNILFMRSNAMSTLLKKISLAALLMTAFSLGACVVVPAHRHYAGDVVAVAPPPPRVEIIGTAPSPGYVWIDGYWSWSGGRHEWVGGRWEAPHRGYRWVPHRWHHDRDGWRLHEGHWERR